MFRCFNGTTLEMHVSRDKQIPVRIPNMYRRMSVFSTSSVVAKIHAPQTPLPVPALQSPVECLLRTQQSCRRAACHGDPTCPVLVVSTFVLKVSQALHQITPFVPILHLPLLGVAVGVREAIALTSVLKAM